VQEQLPGAPLGGWDELEPWAARRLIELNEQLAGKRVANAPPWPERLYADVFEGHRYVDLALLEHHSAQLLTRCQDAVRRAVDELADPGDIVHWDYTTANVLASGEQITGVIDWDGVCSGDRLFDLVTMFYYTRTPALREHVLARRSENVFAAYLAGMIVRQTAFSLKFHAPGVSGRLIADGLALTEPFAR
jgi:Ser/Thr protein kinase RdoA (MazF antagonist)